MNTSENAGKQVRCLQLLDALSSKVRGTKQFCTPGHRSGKAFAMYADMLLKNGMNYVEKGKPDVN